MYRNLRVSAEPDNRIRLSGPCTVTGKEYSVVVSREGFIAYFEGQQLAQDSFPELSREEREFLISGTSPEGWKRLVGDRP